MIAKARDDRDLTDRARSLCDLAWRYLDQVRPDDAVVVLDAALAEPPETLEAFLTIAEASEAAGAPRLALRALQAARLRFPNDIEPRLRLAQRLFARQNFRLAALVAVSGRSAQEPTPTLDLIAARAWHACGEDRRALEVVQPICALAEPSAEALRLRAQCLAALGLSEAGGGTRNRIVANPTATSPATLAGDLADFSLPDFLEFLSLQQKTGVLTVLEPSGKPLALIWLACGRLFGTWAPRLKPIGHALGLAEPLFADVPRSEERFAWVTDRLVAFGQTNVHELGPAADLLARHALQTVLATLRAPEGRVEFRAFSDRTVPVSLDSRGTVLEALRLIDEDNRHAAS